MKGSVHFAPNIDLKDYRFSCCGDSTN